MPYVVRWFWWCLTSVNAACWGRKHFGERNFFTGGVFRRQIIEVGADETAVECCCNVVWMAFYFLVSCCVRKLWERDTNHQTVIQHPSLTQSQLSYFITEHYTCYYRSSRRAQPSSQWNWIYDMYSCFNGERSLAMASEYIQRRSCDQVAVCTQWHLVRSLSLICNHTVQRSFRRLRLHDFDAEFQPNRESEANDIKSRANICGGAGYFCLLLAGGLIGREEAHLW